VLSCLQDDCGIGIGIGIGAGLRLVPRNKVLYQDLSGVAEDGRHRR
jgi:hypothetical protein